MYKCLDELGSVWDQPDHGEFAGYMSYLYAPTCFLPFSAQLNLLLGELEDTPDPGECLVGHWVSAQYMYKCLDELGSDQDQLNHGEFEEFFLSYCSCILLFASFLFKLF